MNDSKIIELYFARSDDAISETDKKYGRYCRSMTYNILGSREDSEECVNDTYMKLWETIPPEKPARFGAYVVKTARNIALNLRDRLGALKRGGDMTGITYDEIAECLPDENTVEKKCDDNELARAVERFISSLPVEKQKIFLRRYFAFEPVSKIASEMKISEEKVKVTLHRTRVKMREFLEKEGFAV